MTKKAIFYHAGCPVCVSAEQSLVETLDRNRIDVEVVHLGESGERVAEAEAAGVKSVPALVIDSDVFHINHGADLSALKQAILSGNPVQNQPQRARDRPA